MLTIEPPPGGPHRSDDRLQAEEGADEIDLEGSSKFSGPLVLKGPSPPDPLVVDQNRQRAHGLGRRHRRRPVAGRGHV